MNAGEHVSRNEYPDCVIDTNATMGFGAYFEARSTALEELDVVEECGGVYYAVSWVLLMEVDIMWALTNCSTM